MCNCCLDSLSNLVITLWTEQYTLLPYWITTSAVPEVQNLKKPNLLRHYS